MKKLIVKIEEFNGGQYGRKGERLAVVMPEYFKNGNLIKSRFKVVQELGRTKKGYRVNGNCSYSERIKEVICEYEDIDDRG